MNGYITGDGGRGVGGYNTEAPALLRCLSQQLWNLVVTLSKGFGQRGMI